MTWKPHSCTIQTHHRQNMSFLWPCKFIAVHAVPLGHTNKARLHIKLLSAAVSASQVNCGTLMNAQWLLFCSNVWKNPPSARHPHPSTPICDCILENRPYGYKYWNPFFACRWMPHSCTIQRHHALETRWLGLLFQAAFLRRCKTTRVHFMACVAPEGHL